MISKPLQGMQHKIRKEKDLKNSFRSALILKRSSFIFERTTNEENIPGNLQTTLSFPLQKTNSLDTL